MPPTAPPLRRARASDAPGIAAVCAAGFETYRSFAPPGWEPPADVGDAEQVQDRMRREDAFTIVAEGREAVVGAAMLAAARTGRDGPVIEGLAHVSLLFVAEAFWGTGLAAALLGGLVDEMRARGYPEARLYTPAGQHRARRFYVREGWTEVPLALPGPPELGLDIVELRRRL